MPSCNYLRSLQRIQKLLQVLNEYDRRGIRSTARIGEKASNFLAVNRGLRQRDTPSALLFNTALESIVRKTNTQKLLFSNHRPLIIVAFADYMHIVENSTVNVKRVYKN